MAVDIETIEEAFVELFYSITGVLFIIGNQNGPRPVKQYGTVYVTDVGSQGRWDAQTYENNGQDLTETIKGTRLLQVSVNVFKGNARTVLSKIDSGIHRSSSIEKLNELNLGFQSKSGVRDISAEVEANQEQRAQMDIFVHATSISSETVTSIENFKLNVTYETPEQKIQTEIEADTQ